MPNPEIKKESRVGLTVFESYGPRGNQPPPDYWSTSKSNPAIEKRLKAEKAVEDWKKGIEKLNRQLSNFEKMIASIWKRR